VRNRRVQLTSRPALDYNIPMNVEISKHEGLAAIFRALGDPTRLRVFELLRCCDREVDAEGASPCCSPGSLSVGEVCCQFDQSMSTVSHHLRELRLAGLIRTEKRGRTIYCSVDPAALELVRQFLDGPKMPEPELTAAPAGAARKEEHR
jgi:ArsR family transcriptional regulator, arsenate/arsenite/antimonite-responsive transcriptional repressor